MYHMSTVLNILDKREESEEGETERECNLTSSRVQILPPISVHRFISCL